MGRKRLPGLYKRGGVWHIDKKILGRRICEATGASSIEEAEKYLAKRMEQIREAQVYGVRPSRTFREAASKYVLENQEKASIGDDEGHLECLDKFIGDLYLEQVHNGTLQPFIEARKKAGRKAKTINLALGVVRHILNLAASEWIDENGLTWLSHSPKIKMLPLIGARTAYPLSWDEQVQLFNALPLHLRQMALFKVNTGCREQEVCQLKWEWEIKIPELNTSIFIIPAYIKRNSKLIRLVKNGEDRLVVLNQVAAKVIEQQRGQHPEYVFTYRGHPLTAMNNSAWQTARKKVGLNVKGVNTVRVHDLKHTFGARLRAAGVSEEDRKDLLGHKSRSMTTHYSGAQLTNLIVAANKACDRTIQGPILTLLKNRSKQLLPSDGMDSSRKNPASDETWEKSRNKESGLMR
jgi:integrase